MTTSEIASRSLLFHCQSVLAMTELLERASARLKTLPSSEQDAIALL